MKENQSTISILRYVLKVNFKSTYNDKLLEGGCEKIDTVAK